MTFKTTVGVWIIRGMMLIPVVIWLFLQPLEMRFGSTISAFISMGQLAGLLGMTGFALTLIMSARLSWMERLFDGLGNFYSVHHVLGVVSFVLLLIHPASLALAYAQVSIVSAAELLLPGGDKAVTLGIFSLLLMTLVLFITMFARKMPYQWLKRVHMTFGLILLLGGLHAFLIPSDISMSTATAMLLRYYILGLTALSLVAYTYRTILGRWLVPRLTHEVVEVNTPAKGVVEVVMRPVGKHLVYLPGQFVFLSFKDPVVSSEIHPFSISSAPHDEFLRITIKNLGDYTATLDQLSIGATAYVEGPYGTFSYITNPNKRQVWIAGGVGATPFISMARDLVHRKPEGYSVDLYYTVCNNPELMYANELAAMHEKYPGLRVFSHCSDERGFLTAQLASDTSNGLFGKEIFVCGPPPMMQGITGQLLQGGTSKTMIHTEAFKML